MRASTGLALLFGGMLGCSAASEPPPVTSFEGPGAGGSSPITTAPCTPTDTTDDAGNFNFDATPDVGLGIGTTNPTTPSEGGTAFSGDATVSPSSPAPANPCR